MDRFVRDREVVGRRKSLLLRAVARVRLDELVEYLADDRRDQLVGRDGPEPPDRVPTKRVGASWSDLDGPGRERERMTDPDDRVVAVPLSVDGRPVEDGGKIASP